MSAHTHAGLGISVIVSSYNYERYLAEALDSVLAQTLAPLEVIVVDDGSTDGSVELLRSRYGNEPRVRVFQQANGGQLSVEAALSGAPGGAVRA
jgi:glycosyltransferase involved in cell wall biosynthesis